MTPDEIRKARSLIATVGNPEGLYAEEVMKLLRQALTDLEAAALVVEAAQKLIHTEKWPFLLGGGFLAHAVAAYEKKPFEEYKPNTCENYRMDSGEVVSRFCGGFETKSQVHSSTCQFFKKEGP